jgi:hypothetical protein
MDIAYDAQGRISSLKSRGSKPAGELRFEYEEKSWHPTKLTAPGIGSLRVTYNASGDITHTESDGGREVALKVTGLFGVLQDAIRPAGVKF